MKLFSGLATALALITPALADFYLYAGVTVSDSGQPEKPEAYAVSSADRGNCDGIDHSPLLDGASGDTSYPWPENDFKTRDLLCGIDLKFIRNGNDYNVYDDGAGGNQVGTCTKGNGEIKFCYWGLISAEYQEDYFCRTSVC